MNYFNTQQQAIELFNKLKEATEVKGHSIVFIVVPSKPHVKALITDLATLLQHNSIAVKKDGIQIKETPAQKAIRIKVIYDKSFILINVHEDQIITLGGE